jgi:hypothetical protein
MTMHKVVSEEEWLAARQEVLVKERSSAQRTDGLSAAPGEKPSRLLPRFLQSGSIGKLLPLFYFRQCSRYFVGSVRVIGR